MKVKELISQLLKVKQDKEIAFSSDEEGNAIYTDIIIQDTEFDKGKIITVVYPIGGNLVDDGDGVFDD
jgi:hypothetical protein